MKKGNIFDILIEDVEFPGYGVGYIEGKKIYVPSGVPGEKLSIRIKKLRKSHGEGVKLQVIDEVDYNKETTCPHYLDCGGCSHQSVRYDAQLDIKEKEVLKLFEKNGLSYEEFQGIEGSPKVFEYRNKMEFTFGDMLKGGELSLGMHMKGKGFSIITTDCCRIVDGDYRKILSMVLKHFQDKDLHHYNTITHEGYLRNLVIRKGENTGEIMVNIVTTSQEDFDFKELSESLIKEIYLGKLVSLLHTVNDSWADTVKADKVEVLYGRDYIYDELLEMKFKISPFSFFQTNTRGAEKLYSIVGDFLGETKEKVIFDLYCGTGTIGQCVAKSGKKVIGIELVEEAVEAAKENAKLNGLENCTFISGDVAEKIKEIDVKPDIIIVDPPRPGVSEGALTQIVGFGAEEIIYISCNPKSLMEDLKYLVGAGYQIKKVRVMDMFPHTPHVETVVSLQRINS
jgi:23S rRNA (uracil1939-C5)-methyltransferase